MMRKIFKSQQEIDEAIERAQEYMASLIGKPPPPEGQVEAVLRSFGIETQDGLQFDYETGTLRNKQFEEPGTIYYETKGVNMEENKELYDFLQEVKEKQCNVQTIIEVDKKLAELGYQGSIHFNAMTQKIDVTDICPRVEEAKE